MQAIMDSVRPRMDSVRLHINDEIAAALPADRRARFEELRNAWRAQRARRDSAHRGNAGERR